MRQVMRPAAFAFSFLTVLAACGGGADTSGPRAMSEPAEIVEGYVAAYNAQDIEGVMSFMADNAVVIQGSDQLEGADVIRNAVLEEFEIHAPGGDAYSISNLVVVGDTATWDHQFKGTAHTCNGTRNVAVIEDGLIVKWTFAYIECD